MRAAVDPAVRIMGCGHPYVLKAVDNKLVLLVFAALIKSGENACTQACFSSTSTSIRLTWLCLNLLTLSPRLNVVSVVSVRLSQQQVYRC